MQPEDLDATDLRLLHRLAEDVAPDLTGLAGDIGTTVEDATRRFAALVSAGVITECAARVEPAAVGVSVTAFLLVRAAPHGEGYAVVRRTLKDLEVVEDAHAVSDHGDWMLKVHVASSGELDRLVDERLAALPGFVQAQRWVVQDTAADWVNADRVRLAGR